MGHLLTAEEPEETLLLPPRQRPPRASEGYRLFIEQVVRELGRLGDAVIVGHAGHVVLRDSAGVVKVLLRSSGKKRTDRVAENQRITHEDAQRLIKDVDQQRQEFFKRVYHVNWLDAANYDVVLNTDRLSLELARDMIVAVAREVP